MAFPNAQSNPAAAIPVYLAGGSGGNQPVTPPTPAPTTLAGGATWNSGIIAGGWPAVAASAELTQAGVLTITRYIDAAGTVPIGGTGGIGVTQAMTASTLATLWLRDGVPFASWQVSVTNSSGSTGTLSLVNILEST